MRVRLGKSRDEQIESACPQAADVRDDPTEGPGWATSGLMRRNNAAFHSITSLVRARAKMRRQANL
jgi:hypothetical protein